MAAAHVVQVSPIIERPFAVLEFYDGTRLVFVDVEALAAFCCERVAEMMHLNTEDLAKAAGLI